MKIYKNNLKKAEQRNVWAWFPCDKISICLNIMKCRERLPTSQA